MHSGWDKRNGRESEGSCRWRRRRGVASKSRQGVRERKWVPATGSRRSGGSNFCRYWISRTINPRRGNIRKYWSYICFYIGHRFTSGARPSSRRARLRSSLDNTWWFASYFTPYRWWYRAIFHRHFCFYSFYSFHYNCYACSTKRICFRTPQFANLTQS